MPLEDFLEQLSGDQVRVETRQRFDALLKVELEAQRLTGDLGKASSKDAVFACNTLLTNQLAELGQLIEDLDIFAQEQLRLSDERVLTRLLAEHRQAREQLGQDTRRANLLAKRNVQRSEAAERQLLLEPSESGLRRREAKTAQDQLLAAQRLTDSLADSHRLMSEQLELSMVNSQGLDQSSQVIKDTHTESNQYGHTMKTSHSLISKLQRRDATDKALLLFGLLFFVLVILYVVKSRLGYRFGFLFG